MSCDQKTPEILCPAVRQYRHNNDNSGSLFDSEKGFVMAFEAGATIRIVCQLQEENARLERDAARYRWLRDNDNFPEDYESDISKWDELCTLAMENFDDWIDKHMSPTTGAEGVTQIVSKKSTQGAGDG